MCVYFKSAHRLIARHCFISFCLFTNVSTPTLTLSTPTVIFSRLAEVARTESLCDQMKEASETSKVSTNF